jgi:hypothetical protein
MKLNAPAGGGSKYYDYNRTKSGFDLVVHHHYLIYPLSVDMLELREVHKQKRGSDCD